MGKDETYFAYRVSDSKLHARYEQKFHFEFIQSGIFFVNFFSVIGKIYLFN